MGIAPLSGTPQPHWQSGSSVTGSTLLHTSGSVPGRPAGPWLLPAIRGDPRPAARGCPRRARSGRAGSRSRARSPGCRRTVTPGRGCRTSHLHVSRPGVSRAENPAYPVPSDALLAAWAGATGVGLDTLTDLAARCRSAFVIDARREFAPTWTSATGSAGAACSSHSEARCLTRSTRR